MAEEDFFMLLQSLVCHLRPADRDNKQKHTKIPKNKPVAQYNQYKLK